MLVRRPTVTALLLVCVATLATPLTVIGEQAVQPEGLRLLSSDAAGISLELLTPAYEVQDLEAEGRSYHSVSVPGYGKTDEVGKPELPIRALLLGVPPDAHLSLDVTVLEEGQSALGLRVRPVSSFRPLLATGVDESTAPALGLEGAELAEEKTTGRGHELYPGRVAQVTDDAIMRGQRIVRLELHPFQLDTSRDVLLHHRRVRVTLRFDYEENQVPAARGTAPDPAFESVYQGLLLNYDSARGWRQRPAPVPDAVAAPGQSHAVKLLVGEDGIHKISYGDLVGAGVVVDTLDPRSLRVQHGDQELSIIVSGEQDGRFDSTDAVWFFAQAWSGKYSDVNVYSLSFGGVVGQRMAERDVSPDAGSTPGSFLTTVRFEENSLYLSDLPHAEADHWFWQGYRAGSVATKTFTVTLESVAAGPHAAVLRPRVWGYSEDFVDPDHRLDLIINGTYIGQASWDGRTAFLGELHFDQQLLVEGDNTITVEAPGDTGAAWEEGYVDWLEVDYLRRYETVGEWLAFDGEAGGPQLFEVTGWSAEPALLMDVTNPLSPVRLTGAEVTTMGATETLRFSDDVPDEIHYWGATAAGLHHPLLVADSPSALASPENGADYIIISHPDFLNSLGPLLALRASLAPRVMLVDVTDVYDEFNGGMVHPDAITGFLDYAYHHWEPPQPAYVLLVGDGTFDPLDHLGTGKQNFIPAYLLCVDPATCETATDNRYVTVDGEDILPDLHIGRLPVNSEAEAQTAVQKLLTYEEALPAGDWRRRVLFVADNADAAGDFPLLSDRVADDLLPEPYQPQKVYYQQTHTTVAETQQAILDGINEGALLVSYMGWGGYSLWADELIFGTSSLGSLTNGDRLPVMVPMTSVEGSFHHPLVLSLAEEIVRLPGQGAVASWAPTGRGVAYALDFLHQGFYSSLFQDWNVYLGPATAKGKLTLFNEGSRFRDLIDTYVLLGDAAMAVALELPVPPTVTPTSTPTATATPSSTPTATPSATPTVTASATPSPTATPSGTATPTAMPPATWTATPSSTSTRTATPTRTPPATWTAIPSSTSTRTATPTRTPPATWTVTPSSTPTRTATPTRTHTATFTPSPTPTRTATPTRTPTVTPSATPTGTPSRTPTHTTTPTPSATRLPKPTWTPTATERPTDHWVFLPLVVRDLGL